jgi:quinoprotein dehydrogenase-associated probable ABC transporter substrate-binding protein
MCSPCRRSRVASAFRTAAVESAVLSGSVGHALKQHALQPLVATLLATLAFAQQQPPERVLRVAADPNNLPFSNQSLEGFDNKIAQLIARELHAKLEYDWRAQRRGFFRQTLKEGNADFVVGVPAHFDMALTTAPLYRSTYVFVTRKDRNLDVTSFDDAQLQKVKIGVQLIGNDGIDTPPAHALAARGIVTNVRGFTLYGDYTRENPPARIIDAVANGDIDIAIAWGPLAGFFAKRARVPLQIKPVKSQTDSTLRFAFDVCVGVRKKDGQLREQIDNVLSQHRDEINRILESYNIPRAPPAAQVVSSL